VATPTHSYWVDVDQHDRDAVRRVCHTLIDVLGPILQDGFIDGYSDFGPSEMDDDALDALELIRERAKQRSANKKWFGNPENLMGIDLDVSHENDRRILRDFGPWTIHTEIYSRERTPTKGINVLCFDDSGSSITAELTKPEATKLVDLIPPGTKLVRL
jgi:hypothetical protein